MHFAERPRPVQRRALCRQGSGQQSLRYWHRRTTRLARHRNRPPTQRPTDGEIARTRKNSVARTRRQKHPRQPQPQRRASGCNGVAGGLNYFLRLVQRGDDVAQHGLNELLATFVLYFFAINVSEIKAIVGAAFFGVDAGEFDGEAEGV